jgi:hypothetical protein
MFITQSTKIVRLSMLQTFRPPLRATLSRGYPNVVPLAESDVNQAKICAGDLNAKGESRKIVIDQFPFL